MTKFSVSSSMVLIKKTCFYDKRKRLFFRQAGVWNPESAHPPRRGVSQTKITAFSKHYPKKSPDYF